MDETVQNSLSQRSAQGAQGLERKYVTCRNIFELESESIFSSSWICLHRVAKLENGSGVLPICFENNRILVVLDSNGEVNAFRNFCRHRGSQLVTDDNCSKIGQRIQCPYHAWTYNRDGRLLAAPNMDDVPNFSKEDFSLEKVPCEVYGGFVWVNLQPEKSVAEFLMPIQAQFDEYQLKDLEVVAELNYEVRANWKLIFQNYNECYHCPTVHPALNRLTPYTDSSNLLESGPILGGPMKLADDCETMSTDGLAVANPFPRLNDDQKRCVNYFTIFPTIFLSTHPDYVLIHRLERLGVEETRVTCEFLVDPNEAEREDFDASRAVEFWDMTNRQDWHVCELAQSGMQDPCYIPGPYSNLESVLAAFDRNYFEAMRPERE